MPIKNVSTICKLFKFLQLKFEYYLFYLTFNSNQNHNGCNVENFLANVKIHWSLWVTDVEELLLVPGSYWIAAPSGAYSGWQNNSISYFPKSKSRFSLSRKFFSCPERSKKRVTIDPLKRKRLYGVSLVGRELPNILCFNSITSCPSIEHI